MPFLLPAAATAVAAAAPAAAATAGATVSATLTSIATNIAMNVAISAAMSALQPQVGAAGRTSEWLLSPDGPIPFSAGRIGVAGSVVHRDTFGPDLMYLGVPSVLSGAGPIDGYESFKADDELVAFDASGKAITSQYAGELWFTKTLGNQPDVALASPSGLKNNARLTGWGLQQKLSGKATYMVVMGENSKGTAFPTGEIKPLITHRGLRFWDPRLDSTWPGGSGPCRLHDTSTWVYIRRPGLWALKWALGLWEGPTLKGAPAHGSATDYQVGGIGATLAGVDVQAFIALENICDAYDWTVSAYPTTDDDKFAVLESFLQAGGATYATRAGKISCIQRAAPRASVVTISAGDTAGPLEIDTAASRIDRINTIRPRMLSEPHRWQLTAITEVSADAWRTEDGGTRPRGIDYTYVSDATQTAQLAALQIANTREGIAGVIPLKPHLQKIRPGDAFTISEPGFVLNGVKCLCLTTDFDPATKVVAVSFVTETDGKYAFALGQTQEPPQPPVVDPVDSRLVTPPGPTEWQIQPRPPGTGGSQMPGFDLVGSVENATATGMLVEWGQSTSGPWTQAYLGPPTATHIAINGVQPGSTYFAAVTYIRDQNYSVRVTYGPYTVPRIVSDDLTPTGPGRRRLFWDQLDEARARFDADMVAEAEAEANEVLTRDLVDVLAEVNPVQRRGRLRGGDLDIEGSTLDLLGVATRSELGLDDFGDVNRPLRPDIITDSGLVTGLELSDATDGLTGLIGSVGDDLTLVQGDVDDLTLIVDGHTSDISGIGGDLLTVSDDLAILSGSLGDLALLDQVDLDSQVTDGSIYTRFSALEQGRLAGMEDGATAGADFLANLLNLPLNLAGLIGSEELDNAAISLGADGSLIGGGGGAVTLLGLGFIGDADATNDATVDALINGLTVGSFVPLEAGGVTGQGDLALLNAVDLDTQVTEGALYRLFSADEQDKLLGIAPGAQVNPLDLFELDPLASAKLDGLPEGSELGALALLDFTTAGTNIRDTDGNVVLAGRIINDLGRSLGVIEGGTKRYSNGQISPMGGQAFVIDAEDGEVITYATEYPVPPLIVAANDGLDALDAGEYYQLTPTGQSGSGFTARARRVSPGSSPVYTTRLDDGTTGSDVTIDTDKLGAERNKALSGVAYNETYVATVQLNVRGEIVDTDYSVSPPIFIFGSVPVTVTLYGKATAGGPWVFMGSTSFSTQSTNAPVAYEVVINGAIEWEAWEIFTGMEYRVAITQGGNTDRRFITAFTSVSYQEQTGGSSPTDVTALSGGRKVRYQITPKDG